MFGLISSITAHLRRLRDSLGEIADMADAAQQQLRDGLGHEQPPALEHHNGEPQRTAKGRGLK